MPVLEADRQSKMGISRPAPAAGWGVVARRPWLVGLLGLGLVLLGLVAGLIWSYRASPAFELDLGSKEAQPFIDGFYEPERRPGDGLTYRWTRGTARILVPGFGRREAELTLRLASAGPDMAPPPTVAVLAGGQEVARLATGPELRAHVVPIGAALMANGDVTIELRTATFQPPRDARRLGVLVDHVDLRAVEGSAAALPPWRLGLLMAIVVAATALVGGLGLARPGAALALAGLLAGLLVGLSRLDRYTLALWLGEGTGLVAVTSLLVVIGLGLADWWRRARAGPAEQALAGERGDDRAATGQRSHAWAVTAGRLALILWLVALVNLLGVAHPQFRTSDLTMNVHRLEDVARGQWLFTLALPGRSAIPAPYPPAFYALLLPLLPLVDHDFGLKQLLITHASALMMVGLAAIAFVVGTRVAGPATGLWAALLHGLAPAGFLLVSQGNFANIFGQWAAGLVLLLLVLWPDWRRPLAALTLVVALGLALLGHFGVFLTLLLAVPLLAGAVALGGPAGRRQGLVLLGLFGLALAIAFLLYYRHYLGLIGEVAQRVTATRAAEGAEGLGWRAGPLEEWRRTVESLGWLALPLAAAGLGGLWRSGTVAGRLVLGWLAASGIFGLVGVGLGLSVRYHFFALLGLAVAAGWTLAWLGRRGWAGRGLALLLAASWLGGGLAFWWLRIFWYTRLPT